ncbi:glycosyl hydrolase family 28-related protein [Candidatus Methylacidiphilum infernorum]|uniref:Endopolygalacturonase n=1 Tax=Methylacidiphilum infernorum (isolate V4) TaxID=481448 RepID=B3DXF3_METI4|nr:glycosyl hydrolase family 28-related protein [Candidatus Methylacidiphilum infernorum]ACD83862.1 Endopolygalacturonase [Methylacidiphilum infernorum V4]
MKIFFHFFSFYCFLWFSSVAYSKSSSFWVSEPVEPADGVIVYGWGFVPKEEVLLWSVPDDDPKTGYVPFSFPNEKKVSLSPIQVSEQSIKFEIPAVFPPGIFGVEIAENRFLINRPQIEWCQPSRLLPGLKQDEAYPGSELCLIGRNILLSPEDVQKLKVMVVPKKGTQPTFLETLEAEKYCCRVKIPETLPVGEYDLFIHNGHGGQSGWSEAFLLRVVNPTAWPSKIFNIKEYGAKGDGLSDDSEALRKVLKAAESNGGGIVYIPAGTYKVGGSFFIPPKTLIEGDGTDFSWLNWPENEPHGEEDFIPAALFSSGQFALEELSIRVRNAKRVLVDRSALGDEELLGNAKDWEDLSLVFQGKIPFSKDLSDVFLRNIRIQFLPFYGYPHGSVVNGPLWKILRWGLEGVPGVGFSLALGSLENVEISGCEIIGCRQRAVHLKNGRITQNSFYNPMGAFCWTEMGGERLFVEDNWFSDESTVYRRLAPLRFMYVAHNQFSEFGRGSRLALSIDLGFPMGKKKTDPLAKIQPLKATIAGTEIIFKEGNFAKDSLVDQQILIVEEDNKEPLPRKVIANSERKLSLDQGTSLPLNKEIAVYFLPWSSPFAAPVESSEASETKILGKNVLPGLVGLDVLVVSGKGAGQLRKVTAQNSNAIRVDRPWDVPPDFSSLLFFYQWEGKSIFFENQAQDCRFLFPLSGFAYDVLFDGNQLRRSQGLIAQGGYFIQWLNNVLDVAVNYPLVENRELLRSRIKSPDFGTLGFLIDQKMGGATMVPFETIRGGVMRSNRLAFGQRIVVGIDHGGESASAQAVVGKDLLIDHNWFEHGPVGIEIGGGIRQAVVRRNLYFDVKEPLRIKEKKEIVIKD